ncbi:hypothetical protein CLIB1423_15S02476 [[Candida] railenensis]|uniref:LicD/FKTN/FKRP nucleotidyltransferase domain-containing protein n=1 Tax=[Candida] railenensis TaxID=45579 RepID=A0A9P0QTI3_9ASCO|nr:hypothetical protein CLIB1423_15S02476 [[Candida] railenensis]
MIRIKNQFNRIVATTSHAGTGSFKKIGKLGLILFAFFNVVFITGLLLRYSDIPSTEWSKSLFESYLPSGSDSGNSGVKPDTQKPSSNDNVEAESNLLYNHKTGGFDFDPSVPYDKLTTQQKIQHKLNEVANDKDQYWLAHTELTDYEIQIDPKEFTKEACKEKAKLFFDPRFTYTVVLNEIQRQFAEKNKNNARSKVQAVEIPFAWSDWADLTVLNPYIENQDDEGCEMLAKSFNEPTKDPEYCVNANQVSDKELKEKIGLPSKKFLPAFSIRRPPMTVATNEIRILEGKSHLLTYAANPINVIFLTKNGVYEAYVKTDKIKERIVDSDLFENYMASRHPNYKGEDRELVTLNPVEELANLVETIPSDTSSGEDVFGMTQLMRSKDVNASREINIPPSAFNYQQDAIERQLKEFKHRLDTFEATLETDLELDETAEALTPHEKLFYKSLQTVNSYDARNEYTYFKMARLKRDSTNQDDGYHYEWRFFNGALRYVKPGWNADEMLIREKIVLDRILRNWFRFASERGILSWIAHGPLLAWYWDGVLFPFDEDIDIQLPAVELVRFAKNYNQTLVVEDVAEGFGKFFIDCNTFLHHRDRTYRENHIDARFIDVDTGSYIDITGLGISEEKVPERFKETTQTAQELGEPRPVYNCRNAHFYSQHQISPLRLSSVAGTPLYIPNRLDVILKDEYPRGMTWYEYYNFYFVDKFNLWLHVDKMKNILPKDLNLRNNNDCIRELQALTDEQVLKLIKEDKNILLEYYLTREHTTRHREEMSYLFENKNGKESTISQLGKQKPSKEISENLDYNRLTSTFQFGNPMTRPLYNFEYIDRHKKSQKSSYSK